MTTTYLLKLSFTDTISVENNSRWFETCCLVKLDEQFSYHGRQLLNDFLPVLLNSDGSGVSTRMGIHTGYNL